ncbi:MAG: cysteine desulfurase [Eubacteriales bacterium]|nr:cysteine desulfurase [Clostridiales bacterium]MDY4897177.1 cysteine desulfurase [Eubacteriales bacterium]MDD6013257.1 cysteine desulfurase [Clostridiales bacterium]MDD7493949.1 cysteine desulfurase [Clostridiales bacterium]MDY5366516.1 cysteine desulfurase [Eubacteriales bacterium]
MIYLDNAATTLHKPQQVIDAVVHAMQSMGNCARGTHEEALDAARTVYDARVRLASLFGCPRVDHVAFTANSTEALNIAINGLIGPGDHVISTDLEHNSVLRPLYRLEAEHGAELSFVPADKLGNVDYADFERLMKPNTRAVVCTNASNLTGTVLDIERIAKTAHSHGALVIVDASQTAGCWPIDMKKMGIDVLCFTGHKGLMGPQGTGGICVKEGIEIRPFKVGGSGVQSYSRTHPAEYPTRLEAGTLNGHGIAGLGAAAKFISETGVENIHAKERSLMLRFYEGVKDIEGVTVYGDFTKDKTAIVALNIRDYESGEVSYELSQGYGIATRPGAHCAPRMHKALGTAEVGAVRFSFSFYNTEEEIDEAVRAVAELAK